MPAALLAALVVGLGEAMGWHGVDTAAQVYRVDSFRSNGFSLWDFRWYGGHWTLDYSAIYPALAATFGVVAVAVVSAAVAALCFDRLVRPALGRGAWAASVVFAAGTVVSSSIGQLTFLTGEAFGMAALWAIARRARPAAVVLALACTLSSPLTGAFLALAVAAWALGQGRTAARSLVFPSVLIVASVGPTLAGAVLFPGDGPMPYPVTDWLWEMVVAAVVAVLAGRAQPMVRTGALLWMVAATVSECVASPLGGNVGRIEDMVALPLAVGLAWSRPPLLLPIVSVPLLLSQWTPAWGAMTASGQLPSAHRAFFQPLDDELARLGPAGPAGRVEVVPTEYHWEAAYVAPVMPLARGWERQLDVADNPLFYGRARLDPASYRAWLLDNGVRFVALANAPLDMAGVREARLVRSGRVPGLALVWQDPAWRLYGVQGAPGIVSGDGRLVTATGGRLVIRADRAGALTVRVRYTPDWVVDGGGGCLSRADRSWISLDAFRPGRIDLSLSLTAPGRSACAPARPGVGAAGD